MGLRLTRSRGQKIVIADGLVTIEVIRVGDNKVELKFDAPRDISIVRGEKFPAQEDQASGRSEGVFESGSCPLSTAGEKRTG